MNAALYTKMLGATNFIVINDWNHFVYVRNICAADFFLFERNLVDHVLCQV